MESVTNEDCICSYSVEFWGLKNKHDFILRLEQLKIHHVGGTWR